MSSLNDMLGGLIGNLTGGNAGAEKTGAPRTSNRQGDNSLMNLVTQLIQKHGGVGGLIAAVKNGGLGDKVDSWIGTGRNEPVSSNEVTDALGRDEIDDLAAKTGMRPEEASSGLAAILPDLVNKLTPDGKVDNNLDDMLKKAVSGFFK